MSTGNLFQSGVLVWAAIMKDELVGSFQVADGLKINSQTHCHFLEDTFFKEEDFLQEEVRSIQEGHDLDAPSHASKYSTAWLASKGLKDDGKMTWPPSSPVLNPIENLWALLKRDTYSERRQYASLNSVWEAVVADCEQI
ncbi:hypothetical protein LDENG_00242360 [Lucifuga dentata]|nr:hypothetical protein LDENG_00242360 [Lucifuga dentata]